MTKRQRNRPFYGRHGGREIKRHKETQRDTAANKRERKRRKGKRKRRKGERKRERGRERGSKVIKLNERLFLNAEAK